MMQWRTPPHERPEPPTDNLFSRHNSRLMCLLWCLELWSTRYNRAWWTVSKLGGCRCTCFRVGYNLKP